MINEEDGTKRRTENETNAASLSRLVDGERG